MMKTLYGARWMIQSLTKVTNQICKGDAFQETGTWRQYTSKLTRGLNLQIYLRIPVMNINTVVLLIKMIYITRTEYSIECEEHAFLERSFDNCNWALYPTAYSESEQCFDWMSENKKKNKAQLRRIFLAVHVSHVSGLNFHIKAIILLQTNRTRSIIYYVRFIAHTFPTSSRTKTKGTPWVVQASRRFRDSPKKKLKFCPLQNVLSSLKHFGTLENKRL